MELRGKVAVVTGAGAGIGEAIARRFALEGVRVVVVDRDPAGVARVSEDLGALGVVADVTVESEVRRVAASAVERLGDVDVWMSNAGTAGARQPGHLQDEDLWQKMWQLHVMSHVYAARAVLPSMLERGDGYLLATASNTGLSLQVEKVAYSVTKRGAIALSEWLAATFGPRGVKVSCFCPGAVLTDMFWANGFAPDSPVRHLAHTPEQAAEVVVEGIRAERFLILTRPADVEVLREKADGYDDWLAATWSAFQERIADPI